MMKTTERPRMTDRLRPSRRVAVAMLTFLALRLPTVADEPDPFLLQAEITVAPVDNQGQQIMTVRLRPATNARHDALVFESVYRQELPTPNDPDGAKRIHEPVRFLYRHRTVELVHDLDWYGSFRVPMDHAVLARAYGRRAFDADHPVTIDRVVIRAESGGQTIWTQTFKVPGRYTRVKRPVDASHPTPETPTQRLP